MSEIDEVEVRKRGRPKGSRGASALKRWVPTEWRPEYTAIVALSATGLSNKAVGDHFGYGPQQISNIINQPQAVEIRRLLTRQLAEHAGKSIGERVAALQDIALKRVEDYVKSDDFYERAPTQMFDRALKVLQGSGAISDPEGSKGNSTTHNTQNNLLVLNEELANKLSEGIARALQVREVHSDIKPISVEPKKLTGLVAD